MDHAPPFPELTVGNNMLIKQGEYYLVYCTSAGSKTVQLAGTTPYTVDLLDSLQMTVTPVGTANPGSYTFSAPKGEVVYRFYH